MITIDYIINDIYGIPEASIESIKSHITEVSFPKGYLLIEADRFVPYVYFLKKGLVRGYSVRDDKDITFWFGCEGNVIASLRSYVDDLPGYENIELLENSILYKIKINDLRVLFGRDIHIANWGRRLAEIELMRTEELIISRQFKTASERYKDLIMDSPDILKRVQLSHIASYLGIAVGSLSRIRTEIK